MADWDEQRAYWAMLEERMDYHLYRQRQRRARRDLKPIQVKIKPPATEPEGLGK